jgi:hypothetical protein
MENLPIVLPIIFGIVFILVVTVIKTPPSYRRKIKRSIANTCGYPYKNEANPKGPWTDHN